MTRNLTLTIDGQDYVGKVARVKSTMLGLEDHGIPTAVLNLEGDGWGVGAGGYALAGAYAMPHLLEIMRVVGVDEWEKLPGKSVVAIFDSGANMCLGLAHISDDKRYVVFAAHASQWDKRAVGD